MRVWYAITTQFYSRVPLSPFDINHSVFLQLLINYIVLSGGRAYLHHRILFKVPVVVSSKIDSALDSVMFSLPLSYLWYPR